MIWWLFVDISCHSQTLFLLIVECPCQGACIIFSEIYTMLHPVSGTCISDADIYPLNCSLSFHDSQPFCFYWMLTVILRSDMNLVLAAYSRSLQCHIQYLVLTIAMTAMIHNKVDCWMSYLDPICPSCIFW